MDRQGRVWGDLSVALFKLAKHEEGDGPALGRFTGTLKQVREEGGTRVQGCG